MIIKKKANIHLKLWTVTFAIMVSECVSRQHIYCGIEITFTYRFYYTTIRKELRCLTFRTREIYKYKVDFCQYFLPTICSHGFLYFTHRHLKLESVLDMPLGLY